MISCLLRDAPAVPARPRTPIHLCPPTQTPDQGCFCTLELHARALSSLSMTEV